MLKDRQRSGEFPQVYEQLTGEVRSSIIHAIVPISSELPKGKNFRLCNQSAFEFEIVKIPQPFRSVTIS